MGQGFDAEYHPNADRVAIYQHRYEKYKEVGSFMEEQTKELAVEALD
jgi:L-ribulokinase